MNRRTLPWNKSNKINVLPKAGITSILYIRDCLFVCTKILFKCGITTITAENFETILSVSTKSELKVN